MSNDGEKEGMRDDNKFMYLFRCPSYDLNYRSLILILSNCHPKRTAPKRSGPFGAVVEFCFESFLNEIVKLKHSNLLACNVTSRSSISL